MSTNLLPTRTRAWRLAGPYAIALLATGVAFVLRAVLHGHLGELPYVTFYAAVMLAAIVGGWGPGLLATATGAALGTSFLPSRLSALDLAGVAVFAASGAFTSVVAGLHRRAMDRAYDRQKRLATKYGEDRFQTMVQAIPGLAFESDPAGNNTFASDRWCEYTGLSAQQAAGWGWAGTIHPDDVAGAQEMWRRGVESGTTIHSKHRVRRKDGTYRWFMMRAEPWRDATGRVVRWAGSLTDIDDEIRAAQALSQSERELRAMFDHAAVGIVKVGADSRIMDANPKLCQMLGYSWKELVGRLQSEFTNEEDQRSEELLAGELLSDRADSYSIEKRLRRSDGGWIWVRATSSVVRAEPPFSICVLEDITERKAAMDQLKCSEERLRRSEQRLTWAMQTAQGGAYELDPVSGAGWWSPEMYELFGVEPGTAVNSELILSCIDPRDRERVTAAISGGADGAEVHVQFRVQHPTQGSRWMETFGRPLPDGDGARRILGITLDITDRKRAEEAVERSEARFRQLANAMPNLAWTASPDGVVDYCNDRVRDFVGFQQRGDGSWEWDSALHPEDREQTRASWKRAFQQGTTHQIEHRLLRTDGRWAWHLTRANPLTDGQGRITKWFGSSTDIDDAKNIEAALRRSEEELRAAKAVADAANAAKREFLAHMSHEIRTPMTAIAGMTDLALVEELSPPVREHLETIKTSSDAVLALLNDILDFSRIEAGRLVLDNSAFDPRSLVRDGLKVVSGPAQDKGLSVHCELAAELPALVIGDALRIGQVLTNLEANAVKFTERGEITVRVALVESSPTHAALRFSVSDTGIGMSPEQQERVFAPYTQGDASMTRRYGGSGLGLAISSGLVELMGGRLELQSELGRGSTLCFTLRLPLASADQRRPGTRIGKPTVRELPEARRHLHILLAEDSPVVQKVVEGVLTKRGHAVDVACNGRQAVDTLRASEFDLVLMDLEMPIMDGLTATAAIRSMGDKGRVPIVAMTAHAMKGDEERCLEAGMDAYLSKPINSRELILLVERLANAA